MKKSYSILCAIILLAISCQRLPQPAPTATYEELRNRFQNPPTQCGLNCWWWWLNGNVTREAITSDLEAMKEKGFQGAMIFDAGGYNQRGNKDIPAGPKFGSKEWNELFVYALDEAERLGLEIGFNIQSGWNLGGPDITPEQAAKLLTHSEVRVEGGREVSLHLEQPRTVRDFYRDIAVLAFPIDSRHTSPQPIHHLAYKLSIHELGGSAPDCRFLLDNQEGNEQNADTTYIVHQSEIIDVSQQMDSEGNFKWKVPEGTWVVMRFGYTCTGAVVSTSSQTWQGLVLDYLKPEAIDEYLKNVVDPILKVAEHHVGKTLTFMETDSWECGGMNWTDCFTEDFKALNGYDVIRYLPVAAGYVVDDMATTHAFLADFRKTVGHDVAYYHYKRFADYAHAHGMGIQPESAGPHAGPFDGVRNYSFSDIVMSEFWAPSPHRPRNCDRFFLKQASSSAHIYGKKIVGAESFTTIGPHWNDEIWHNQKSSFDHEICGGLNRVYFHTFTCSPREMGLPGQEYFAGTHINPRLTWWDMADGFTQYMHRVQSLVQDARFQGDVLYYYGDHTPVIYPYKHADMAGCMPGFDYDVTSEDALLQLMVNREGRIVAPSGLTYRVLVLPDHKVLSMAALKKVEYLLRKGATVIGEKPTRSVSLVGGEDAKIHFASLADKIWDKASEKGSRSYGKGTVAWGISAREFLLSQGLMPDFAVEEDDSLTEFDFIHYTFEGKDLYYVSNVTDKPQSVNCLFRVQGKAPERWDALDGSISSLPQFSQSEGRTRIPLKFDPFGSAIIVFNEPIPNDSCGTIGQNDKEYAFCQTVEGPWVVKFDPKWGGPDSTIFSTLTDWTQNEDEGIRYYSGKANYVNTFTFEGEPSSLYDYYLDLGEVKDVGMARVSLNGTDLGVTWTRPFRVNVTKALIQGRNELEITVANSWFNRVAGDEIHPERTPYTKTNIILSVDFRGQPTSDITLSPSGLLGPVVLLTTPIVND